jgi:outer membrane protein OmpA-like peptidoglycan-associated protein
VFSSSDGTHLHLYSGIIKGDNVISKKIFLKAKTHESNPAFTNDLKTMYYTRSLFGEENTVKYGKDKQSVIAIFKAKRASDGSWAEIKPLPINSEKYDVGHPALNRDNTKLYFSSNMPGTKGKSDIFVVDILGNNEFSKPRNLGDGVNTKGNELHPYVSRDNKLYFSSNGMGGFGGLDIYVVDLNDPNSKAKLLPKPINSKYDDFSYIFDDSKKRGFFSSNRPGGKGGDDIYMLKEKIKEEVVEEVKKEKGCSQKLIGVVFLNASQKRIANALVKLKDSNEKVIEEFKTTENAKFHFKLKCNKKYKIEASKKGYKTSERIMITNAVPDVIAKKNLFITKKLPKGENKEFLFVGTVDFDYNEWKLQRRFMYELDKAIRLMKENEDLVIHFESHTDSRAPADFNMELSEHRIEVLKEYIGFKGIFRKRFSGEAFGETKPINKCVKGVQCTEEEYLANRRTIFTLKEKK